MVHWVLPGELPTLGGILAPLLTRCSASVIGMVYDVYEPAFHTFEDRWLLAGADSADCSPAALATRFAILL